MMKKQKTKKKLNKIRTPELNPVAKMITDSAKEDVDLQPLGMAHQAPLATAVHHE